MKSLFVLAGAFALAACGNNTPPGTTTPVPSAAPAPAEKTSIEPPPPATPPKPLYFGGMYDEAGKLYRFIAVGSTGALVESSRAKFCGVVVGQQHYQNSAGGVAHSVQLVGMFDLPENRTR